MKNNNKKTIAYITGTRADFGLMTPVLQAIERSKQLRLKLVATGIHLMPLFGETIHEVRKEFPTVSTIPALFDSDEPASMARFSAECLFGLVPWLLKERPDMMLLLGDRPEMLAAAVACLYVGIPVAHIHAGDKTGTVDEVARHAITKLAHLHFCATTEAAKRVARLGEEAWRIHVVGAPALDVIKNETLPSRVELCGQLGLDVEKPIVLVTQHPVSEEVSNAGLQMRQTLQAVSSLGLPAVIIFPHADAGGRQMITEIERYRTRPLFYIFPSLPFKQFLALAREAAVWVGNSSGAVIESASFKTPVVNIGRRQLGRVQGANVVNVPHDTRAIYTAMRRWLEDKRYRKKLFRLTNPWGDGQAAERIVRKLEEISIDERLLWKQIIY